MITQDGTTIEPVTSRATTTDLETLGIALGVQCAQRVHRGYGESHLEPDPAKHVVVEFFREIVERFISEQRETNDLTPDGEAAYRRGFDRGLTSQLRNPNATIQVERVHG